MTRRKTSRDPPEEPGETPEMVLPDGSEAWMRLLGLQVDPWQTEILDSTRSRLLLLCSRQVGKSTVTAALALREALALPDGLVLMVAPSLRQSGELFRKLVEFYCRLRDAPAARLESTSRLELANGSRVVSLPGNEGTIRGFSGVRLLAVDEAARVPDELYYSVRPMLAVSNGRLIALSTPYGARGWFHREWTLSSAGWHRVEVPATRCPRISPEFLEEERRTLGETWFGQEYLCRFSETEDQLFTEEEIQGVFEAGGTGWF